MSQRFETYLEKANIAKNKEELFKIYSETVRQHGLDRVLLCLATDHQDIGEDAGMKFLHNYPEDWMSYYIQKGLHHIDPVIIFGHGASESFEWKDIKSAMKLSKEQKSCLDMGIEAGLHNGICTPLRGPNHALGGLSLASSEKKDAFDGNVDLITAYSNHFYVAYRRLGLKQKTQKPLVQNIALTQKEQDVLQWVGQGKSFTDIGVILGISPATVDFHMRNIFKKLGVNSKILAVVMASYMGLIDPPKI